MLESLSYDRIKEENHNNEIITNWKLPKNQARLGRNTTIMWNKLFYTQKEIDITKRFIMERKANKESELRGLEQIYHNKFDSQYMSKLSDLLQRKYDSQYSLKRNHISDTVYTWDENKNMYLTLSEDFKNKLTMKKIKENKEDEKEKEDKIEEEVNHLQACRRNDIRDEKKTTREEIPLIIPEFFPKENNESDDDEDDNNYKEINMINQLSEKKESQSHSSLSDEWSGLNDLEKCNWFQKWKTKTSFFLPTTSKMKNSRNNTHNNIGIDNGNWYLTSTQSVPSVTKQLSNRIQYKRHNKKELLLTTEWNIWEDIKKMREKIHIIKKINNINLTKKLHPVDLFYCDQKRFQIIQNNKNKSSKKRIKIKKKSSLFEPKSQKEKASLNEEKELLILKSGTSALLNNMKLKAIKLKDESKECQEIKEEITKNDFQSLIYKAPKKTKFKATVFGRNGKNPPLKQLQTLYPILKNKKFKISADKLKA